MRIKYFLYLTLFFCVSNLFAQETPLRNFSVHDGLACQHINCLFEDSRGYLWIGTRKGLSKFNGSSFETFNISDGLPHQFIAGITEDSNGDVIALTRKGIAIYNGAEWLSIPMNDREFYGQYRLTWSGVDTLWLIDKVPLQFILSTGEIIEPDLFSEISIPELSLKAFDLDDEGRLFALFNSGKGKFLLAVKSGQKWITKQIVQHFIPSRSIVRGSNHLFFHFFEPYNSKIYGLQADSIGLVADIKTDTVLWKAPYSDTLCLYDEVGDFILTSETSQVKYFTRKSLSYHNRFHSNKTMLFVSHNDYLTQYFWGKFQNYSDLGGVWGITQDNKDRLLASSYNQFSLFIIDKESNVSRKRTEDLIPLFKTSGLPNVNKIIAFYSSPVTRQSGDMYLPSNLGLIKYDGDEMSLMFQDRSEVVLGAFYDLDRDQIIAAVAEGFYIIYPDDSYKYIGLKDGLHTNKFTVSAAADSKGRYWVGSFNGLSLYDPVQEKVLKNFYGHNEPAIKGGVINMVLDNDGKLWMGTAGGLTLLDPSTDELIPVARMELPIYCSSMIELDSAHLLIGSTSGLYRFNKKDYIEEGKVKYTLYNKSNGFMGMDPEQNAMYKDRNGMVWIGCNNMLVKLDPSKLSKEEPKLLTFVRKVNNEFIPFNISSIGQPLHVNDNNVRFYFEAVGIARQEKTNYSYCLEGYDKKWTDYMPVESAQYNRLPNGKYKFCVRAQSNTMDEKENPCSCVLIAVNASLFENASFPFYAAGIIALMAILTLFFAYRYQRSMRLTMAKEQESELLRINTLQSQMNPHFIFNVLSSVQHLILSEEKIKASDHLADFGRMMRLLLSSSVMAGSTTLASVKDKEITLEEEVDLIRTYVELEQLNYQYRFDFELDIDQEIFLPDYTIPPMLLQPFVENAIKHGIALRGDDKGVLLVSIRQIENHIKIVVQDNGVGREQSEKLKSQSFDYHRSVGSQLVKDRINILNNLGYRIKIKIEDCYPQGTKVVILIKNN